MKSITASVAVALCVIACSATAQPNCPDPQWQPFDPSTASYPGTYDGSVGATTMWDPDGPGPQTPKLVVAGGFSLAGNAIASRVALYDPDTGDWSALGAGLDGDVYSLTVLPNGDLVAGGEFTTAGGVPANNIARWDGSNWFALGTGMDDSVRALAVLPNGDLIAGGGFTTAGGADAHYIARWDGSSWSTLGSGMDDSVVTLAVLPSGDLVAGGYFDTAGGVPAANIARWDGATWSTLGSGMNSSVNSLIVLSNGDLIAGGQFYYAGGIYAKHIARWDGAGWSPLGPGLNGGSIVFSLAVRPNGDLIAGGHFFTSGGVSTNYIARWDGTSWSNMGSGMNNDVSSLAVLPNGDLVAGGSFSTAGGVPAVRIARWNGSSWSPLAMGIDGPWVLSLATLPNGGLIMGGWFTTAGGVPANSIASWDGTLWSALGSGMGGTEIPEVGSLAMLPNGDLVAGGHFTTAGGVSAKHIARWDGTSWFPLGSGMSGENYAAVGSLAVLPNGDLVAGGRFTRAGGVIVHHIARWDGSSWSSLGSGISGTSSAGVGALALLPNGDLVVGGVFDTAGGISANRIARWDGSSWSALGSGFTWGYVNSLVVLPNGDLVVGGEFNNAGGVPAKSIARWDGSTWSPLGSGLTDWTGSLPGEAYSLAVLPSGGLVVGGRFSFAGGVPANNIVHWDGAKWSALGSGIVGTEFSEVHSVAMLPNGDLVAGGRFTTIGGIVAPYIARWGCVPTACYADCDESGALDILDYICFGNAYAANDPYADCDSNSTLNILDYICFGNAYAVGCP
ncbi:MAG: hypothetical protein H6815_12790 [Phycisphaeraceae bacterium]|nr:hypothetical protein [Phycisphaerales bacterium]MCB9861319.1 hypothetical protein [Phycisphaeraceae bacterium]